MRRRAGVAIRAAIGQVDPRMRPVLPITFVYNLSFSTFWVYVGVFVVKGLGWRTDAVGVLFLASAPPAAIANYLSGRVSDRIGRKRPIVFGFLASSATTLALALLGQDHALAFVLIVAVGIVGAPPYTLDRVLVADLVSDQRGRESGYAAVRVAENLGLFSGPPLGALLIAAGGWHAFLIAISVLGIVGAVISVTSLPPVNATTAPGHGSAVRLLLADRPFRLLLADRPFRLLLADRPFRLLLFSALLAYVVYCGFETVLPVIAVSTYGIAAPTWGLLVVISPLLVLLLQLRLTAATARIPLAHRLGAGILIMGLPFLALIIDPTPPVIAAVIVVFVLGEMTWMPTSLSIAAQLAPPRSRGSYLGALAAMTGPAWTLTPFIAFTLRNHLGVSAIWVLLALAALIGAVAGLAAVNASKAM